MSEQLIGTLKHYELDFLISVGILNLTAKLLLEKTHIVNFTQDSLCLYNPFSPTTNWSHGGPLIQKYEIKNSGNLLLAMRDLWFSKSWDVPEQKLAKELLRLKERR